MSNKDNTYQEKPQYNYQNEDPKNWSVHTAKNGIQYYYNIKTTVSTWEKPDVLKTEDEKQNTCEWQEVNLPDGRSFYVNFKTNQSVWRMPAEYKTFLSGQIEQKHGNIQKVELKTSLREQYKEEQQAKNAAETNDQVVLTQQQKDAAAMFQDMLKEQGVSANMKWDQVQKLIKNDKRSNLLKTISEKKRVFQDYIQQKRREERHEVRSKIEETKENFYAMLSQGRLDSSCKYYKTAGQFIQDSRWKAVDEREREILFQDYLDDLYQKEKEEQRKLRRENCDCLKEILVQSEGIHATMRWHEFCGLFMENPHFKALSEYDRLITFQEAITQKEQIEFDEQKQKKRTQDRKNREAFKELLEEAQSTGALNHKTKWKSFVTSIQEEKRLLNMIGQQGSTPRELYEDVSEKIKEDHKKIKEELKNYLKKVDFTPTLDTTYQEFKSKMVQNDWFQTLKEPMKNFYYEYCLEKARSKEKEVKKKVKKAKKKMIKYLKTIKDLNSESKYEDFQQSIQENSEKFNSLTLEQRVMTFALYKIGGEDAVLDNDKDKKDKKKKEKKDKKDKKNKKGKKKDDSDSDSDDEKPKRVKLSEDSRSYTGPKIRSFEPEKSKMDIEDKKHRHDKPLSDSDSDTVERQNMEEGQIVDEKQLRKYSSEREEGEESPRRERHRDYKRNKHVRYDKYDKDSKYDRDNNTRRRRYSRSKSRGDR